MQICNNYVIYCQTNGQSCHGLYEKKKKINKLVRNGRIVGTCKLVTLLHYSIITDY